jgi:hypothetical protein
MILALEVVMYFNPNVAHSQKSRECIATISFTSHVKFGIIARNVIKSICLLSIEVIGHLY